MVCPFCGSPSDSLICPVCGKKNGGEAWNPAKSMAELQNSIPCAGTASFGAQTPQSWRAADISPQASETGGRGGGTVSSDSGMQENAAEETLCPDASAGGDYFTPEPFPSAETVGMDDDPFLPDPITPVPAAPPEAAPEEMPHGKSEKKKKKQKSGKKESGEDPAPTRKKKSGARTDCRATVFAAIGFFFPLIYLFADLFVFLGGALVQTGGKTAAERFVTLATNAAYRTNSISELLAAVFGEENPVLLLSLRDISCAGFRVPLIVTFLCVVLCVLAGIGILVFGKKVLSSRVLSDFTVFAGLAGAFAPFAGKLSCLLASYATGGFSAMEQASAELVLSAEALLIVLSCCAFTLPSVAGVRRLSGKACGDEPYIPLLCDLTGASFPVAKALTAVFLTCCLGIGCIFFFGNVYLPAYHLSAWRAGDLLTKTGELLRMIISDEAKGEMLLPVLSLTADVFFAVQLPVLLIGLMALLVRILVVLFTGRTVSAGKGRQKNRNEGRESAAYARRLILMPFWFCLAYQILAVGVLLSFMGGHLDFSAPAETLTVFYLAVANARSLFAVSGAYTLLALVGSLLWHLAGGLHNAMSARRVSAAGKGEL